MGVATWRLSVVFLVGVVACKSSSGAPIDPEVQALAETYCELCCIPIDEGGTCQNSQAGCANLIAETILVVCTEETNAYYQCLVDNACDVPSCGAQWAARQNCLLGPDGGVGGSGGDGGGGGAAGTSGTGGNGSAGTGGNGGGGTAGNGGGGSSGSAGSGG